MTTLKVLIVDDTATYRMILSEVMKEIPDTQVIGTAANGRLALSKLQETAIDIVLLDIEMPELNGLDTLKIINQMYPQTGAVMISGMNRDSADVTIKALEYGAIDFIPKPDGLDAQSSINEIRQKLLPILNLYRARRHLKQPFGNQATTALKSPVSQASMADPPVEAPKVQPIASSPSLPHINKRIDVVTIGVSTGGPNALTELIPNLPGDIGLPILIVQHMPPVFTASLAMSLDKKSSLTVREAVSGEPVLPNTVYIAPGGKHMIVKRAGSIIIELNEDPPENSCRPAVDVLFRSVESVYRENTLAVIMTGMGNDGMRGVQVLKQSGAYCLTQSAESCVVYGMPRAVDEVGLSDEHVDLAHLPGRIVALSRSIVRIG